MVLGNNKYKYKHAVLIETEYVARNLVFKSSERWRTMSSIDGDLHVTGGLEIPAVERVLQSTWAS